MCRAGGRRLSTAHGDVMEDVRDGGMSQDAYYEPAPDSFGEDDVCISERSFSLCRLCAVCAVVESGSAECGGSGATATAAQSITRPSPKIRSAADTHKRVKKPPKESGTDWHH